MGFGEIVRSRPRSFGIACAVAALLLGLVYMRLAGAPNAYLIVQVASLVIGLSALLVFDRLAATARGWSGIVTLAASLALLATALLGNAVEGASRWVSIGPLAVQPSLILLPVAIIGFAMSRNRLSTAAMIVAAIALAIQPDRAMAAMLAAGLMAMTFIRSDRFAIPALLASMLGFAITMAQPDNLPAMPYVDQIFYSSFDVSIVAGLAVIGGSLLLIVPAIAGMLCDANNRERYLTFAAIWAVAIIAAALHNYPTPVVGYSGGAVLGYVLSLAILPAKVESRSGVGSPEAREAEDDGFSNRQLRAVLA